MYMITKRRGVITLDMNENDAKSLAHVIGESDYAKPIHENLAQVLDDISGEIEPDSEQLSEPEYYIHIERGDAMVINWKQNRPIYTDNGWVRVSKQCWEIHTRSK